VWEEPDAATQGGWGQNVLGKMTENPADALLGGCKAGRGGLYIRDYGPQDVATFQLD